MNSPNTLIAYINARTESAGETPAKLRSKSVKLVPAMVRYNAR
jgi:hypothetical protein